MYMRFCYFRWRNLQPKRRPRYLWRVLAKVLEQVEVRRRSQPSSTLWTAHIRLKMVSWIQATLYVSFVYKCVRAVIILVNVATVITVRCYSERGIAMAKSSVYCVCLSVCVSVTLRYRDHIGRNSIYSKIMSPLVSMGRSLFACIPQRHRSTPVGTPWNFDRNRGGVSKKQLLAYKSSVKLCKIAPSSGYYWGPIGSNIRAFSWCKKSTTSDDL